MAVITRWSYKRGGRKAGFHCMEIACVQTSPISFVARGKGNRRRLHAGKYGKVLENVEALLSLFSKYKLFVYGIEL